MKPTLILTALALMLAPFVMADPCGMVPPIHRGSEPAPMLERQGLQKTYVFYKDGVETFAVMPGFTGNVKDFGMLIPVPSIPSLRKIADDTFAHIAAAIDPPEIEVYVGDAPWLEMSGGLGEVMKNSAALTTGMDDADHAIRLVKEEAVGQYQVAVLEAGSANALKIWMTDNDYMFPEGMDGVCNDYIKAKWLFVAIKAKVNAKSSVEPQPGMGDINPDRPAGSAFDGNVQGMAFRFKTDKLVVPMRLSSYNAGETRNVVYVLSDQASTIKGIDKKFVRRQISGEQLYLNLTQPLPLRIYGGGYEDIDASELADIEAQRDQTPHNGLARELFAGDLLALRTGLLELEFETREKQLLKISERLDLRGAEMDMLHRGALAGETQTDYDAALVDLLGMTLTVIDGDFQRKLLRRDNLYFASYEMPKKRNNAVSYDAVTNGSSWDRGGKRWVNETRNTAVLASAREILTHDKIPARKDAIKEAEKAGAPIHNPLAAIESNSLPWYFFVLIGAAVLGTGVLIGLRKKKGGTAALILLALFITASNSEAGEAAPPPTNDQLAVLGDPKTAEDALSKLIANKDIRLLELEARSGRNTLSQGWAIVGLSEIGSPECLDALIEIENDDKQNKLIRCWAMGGLVQATNDYEGLIKLAEKAVTYPAITKPLAKRLLANSEGQSARDLIALSLKIPVLQGPLTEVILQTPISELTDVMMKDKEMNVAQMAAAYLATIGQQQPDEVANATIEALVCPAGTTEVSWKSGALWVPNIKWSKETGTALVTNLMDWGLWCIANSKSDLLGNVVNNLNSINLNRIVGYNIVYGNDMSAWVTSTGKAIGKDNMQELLLKHNLIEDQKFAKALNAIK